MNSTAMRLRGKVGTPSENSRLLSIEGVKRNSLFMITDVVIGKGDYGECVVLNVISTNLVNKQIRECVYQGDLNLASIGTNIREERDGYNLTLQEARDLSGWDRIPVGTSIYRDKIIKCKNGHVNVYELAIGETTITISQYNNMGRLETMGGCSFDNQQYSQVEVEALINKQWSPTNQELIVPNWVIRRVNHDKGGFFRVMSWSLTNEELIIGGSIGKKILKSMNSTKEDSVQDRKPQATKTRKTQAKQGHPTTRIRKKQSVGTVITQATKRQT
jgi:hypothetical protein